VKLESTPWSKNASFSAPLLFAGEKEKLDCIRNFMNQIAF